MVEGFTESEGVYLGREEQSRLVKRGSKNDVSDAYLQS